MKCCVTGIEHKIWNDTFHVDVMNKIHLVKISVCLKSICLFSNESLAMSERKIYLKLVTHRYDAYNVKQLGSYFILFFCSWFYLLYFMLIILNTNAFIMYYYNFITFVHWSVNNCSPYSRLYKFQCDHTFEFKIFFIWIFVLESIACAISL